MRRLVLLLVLLPPLLGALAVVWSGLGWPPALWLVKYGVRPGCEPTGETLAVEGVEFVRIGAGCFRMGSNAFGKPGDLLGRMRASPPGTTWGTAPEFSDEMPVHFVEFPEGFWIARTEVTNAQYERFDPEHRRDRRSDGDDDPVVTVSWEDAKSYCAWLAERSGRPVLLPTESEWECACRAGSGTKYAFGDDEAGLSEYAWYRENSERRAHEVGTKRANAWGLYDLHGNMWEWCEDWYHGSYLVTREAKSSRGEVRIEVLGHAPTDGTAWLWEGGSGFRVFRGGGWSSVGSYCRSADRGWRPPGDRSVVLGFRPALGRSNR